jgi:hypothetical protein
LGGERGRKKYGENFTFLLLGIDIERAKEMSLLACIGVGGKHAGRIARIRAKETSQFGCVGVCGTHAGRIADATNWRMFTLKETSEQFSDNKNCLNRKAFISLHFSLFG